MTQRDDGSYYSSGRTVWRSPHRKPHEGGESISLGFSVCELSDGLNDEAAEVIANALNAARSPAQKGGETDPAARARLADIARLIEDVDDRCLAADGPVTKTRHEMTDDEMREVYRLAKHGPSVSSKPDHTELLREAAKALASAQYRMQTVQQYRESEVSYLPDCQVALSGASEALTKIQEALGDD